jgi:hypothetical protein
MNGTWVGRDGAVDGLDDMSYVERMLIVKKIKRAMIVTLHGSGSIQEGRTSHTPTYNTALRGMHVFVYKNKN